MPFILTYYLTSASSSSSGGGDSGFPGDSSRLVCDAERFDQAHFLSLIDRLLPEEYLRPLKSMPDSGYEIFQALAALAARLSDAMHEVECGLVMLYAGGPTYAEVDVVFYRESAAAGAVTVKTGTLVSTSKGGRAFETIEDAVFGGGDLQVTVAARAVAAGFEYNVPGQRVTAGGEVLPGEIDTVDVMLQDPRYGDPTIKVKQEADASGGYPDWLALHGANRGMVQEEGESADAFRLRMRSLPDTVTPAALKRLATRILTPLGIGWQYVETQRLDYVTCYDAPSPNVGTPSYQATLPTSTLYDSNNFAYDDPRDPDPFRGRMLGPEDYDGGIIFVVDSDVTVRDYGFAFDDPGTSQSAFLDTGTGKQRGTPAFDIVSGDVATVAAFDGDDVAWSAAVASFWAELQRAKAGGVFATIDTYHTW